MVGFKRMIDFNEIKAIGTIIGKNECNGLGKFKVDKFIVSSCKLTVSEYRCWYFLPAYLPQK